MVGYLEVISKRHLLTGESDFSWEVPASRVKLRIAVRPSPDESGGLNGSLQHSPAVYLLAFQIPKSFVDADLNALQPCLNQIE